MANEKESVSTSARPRTESPLSTSSATNESSSGAATSPKEPLTCTCTAESAVSASCDARFCSSAPGSPAPPAVFTLSSAARVEYGTCPATEGIMSIGSMTVTTKVESSVHSPL